MKGTRPFILTGLGLLVSLAVLGCVLPSRIVTGPDVAYTVLPGTSVDLANPCPPGEWVGANSSGGPQDWFRMDSPPGLSINTTVAFSSVSRQLVATQTVDKVFKKEILYAYNTFTKPVVFCEGHLIVTTVTPLTVFASATVVAANTSQLKASVAGGAPPYSFAWTPSTSLNNPTIFNPVATPSTTTTYTVNVTDSVEQTASATTTVTVGSSAGFKLGVMIPFDTPQAQVSVTVGNIACLATIATTCAQVVPGGTQVLLTVVKFPANTTKLFDWNGVTCDISRTPTTCTFTVTKDTSVVPAFI